MAKSYTKYYPLILVICALAVRCIYFYQFQNNPFFDHIPKDWDQEVYDKSARSFANGNLLGAIPNHVSTFSPLYHYFIGIIYWLFGQNLTIVWGMQFLMGTASALLIYFISNHYFKPSIGFIAALLFTFYGMNWLYEGSLYRASFITFLGLASCYSLIKFAKSPNLFYMALSAGFLSLLMQSRSNNIILVPFALTYLYKKVFKQKAERYYLPGFLAVFLLMSIPLLVHGYIVHGSIGLYDRGGPSTLLSSNALDFPGREYIHTKTYLNYSSEQQQDTLFVIRDIIKSAHEHPLAFIKLYLKKIYYYFNNYEVPTTLNFYLFQEFSPVLKWASIPFSFIGSLGIIGFILLRKHEKNWTLVHGYCIANFLMFLPFYVSSRFRLPIIPFLSLFSAYTIWTVFQKAKKRHFFSFATILLCFIFLNLIQKTNPLTDGKIRQVDYINTGSAYLNNRIKEDDNKGYENYKKAWDISRNLKPELRQTELFQKFFYKHFIQEAEKFRQQGNPAKEMEALKQALFYNYSSAITHYNNGVLALNTQNYKAAFFESLQAIVLNPNFHPAHELLGSIYNYPLKTPFWALYHWYNAYNLMDVSEKEPLLQLIKRLQNKLASQTRFIFSDPNNAFKKIQSILQKQTTPLMNLPLNLTLPDVVSGWSPGEVDQYLISLYQHLTLFPAKNTATIYYQLGMLYWKKINNESVALYYFQKAWKKGIRSSYLFNLLNTLYNKKASHSIF